MTKLKQNYVKAVTAYCNEFAKKHDMLFNGFISDRTHFAEFNSFYLFSIDNILIDIDLNAPPKLIIKWYEDQNHTSFWTCLKANKS